MCLTVEETMRPTIVSMGETVDTGMSGTRTGNMGNSWRGEPGCCNGSVVGYPFVCVQCCQSIVD